MDSEELLAVILLPVAAAAVFFFAVGLAAAGYHAGLWMGFW